LHLSPFSLLTPCSWTCGSGNGLSSLPFLVIKWFSHENLCFEILNYLCTFFWRWKSVL
jgi:hypothetical protein